MKVLLLIAICLSSFSAFNQSQIGQHLVGEEEDDESAISLSMPDGYTVAIGTPWNDGNGISSGHVRIYKLVGSTWVQKGEDIDGESPKDRSGITISMPDSNTVAIGAPWNGTYQYNSGHVRIFHWNGTAWVQKGSSIYGQSASVHFGRTVSMPDANTIAIGNYEDDTNGPYSGHTFVYQWDGTDWGFKGMPINGDSAFDYSSYDLSMPDANTLAISAHGHDGYETDAGLARVFQWSGTDWIQKGSDIYGEAADDRLSSVSMPDSNTIAVGAGKNDENGTDAGHARVFQWNGTDWIQKGSDIYGDAPNDNLTMVSMPNANTIAVGARRNDGNGIDSGQLKVFRWNGTDWIQKGSDIYGSEAFEEAWNISMPDTNTVALGSTKYSDYRGYVRVFSICGSTSTDVQEACGSYTWINGVTYTSSNSTAKHILTNAEGCDSVISLNLTINNTASTDVQEACDSYTWIDGNTYSSSNNTATHTLTNVAGCDSLVTLDLTLNNASTGTDIITSCGSYTWIDGSTYNSSNNTATHILTNSVGCDSIVTLDLTVNNASTGTDVISSCDEYTWIDGITYNFSNNVATHTLTNTAGCDSIVTLDLTVQNVDVSVYYTTTTLESQATNADFQWIDCNNGNQPIAGETGQSFTPTTNGEYAVIVTQNNCTDTSICVTIGSLNIEKENDFETIRIYPNPTNGKVTIQLGREVKNISLSVFNTLGQEVIYNEYTDAKNVDLEIDMPSGIYIVKLKTSEGLNVTRRVVKK